MKHIVIDHSIYQVSDNEYNDLITTRDTKDRDLLNVKLISIVRNPENIIKTEGRFTITHN